MPWWIIIHTERSESIIRRNLISLQKENLAKPPDWWLIKVPGHLKEWLPPQVPCMQAKPPQVPSMHAMSTIQERQAPMNQSMTHVRTRASEDRWMVAPSYDEWLTTWYGLTLVRVLQVHVVAWFELVHVKSEHERSMTCRAYEEWRDK
jgi:hypothetical protein